MNTSIKHLATLYIVIGLLIFSLFLQNSCYNNKFKDKINTTIHIPAKDGVFVKIKPHEIKYDTIIKDTIIYKDKKIIIDNTDKEIVKNYLLAKDSIEKLNILLSAVKIRRYQEKFDDNNLSITIDTETTGTLNWIKPSYIIKEQSITVPVINKETIFAIYAGGGLYNNRQLNNPGIKLDLGIQLKKGDIIEGSYDLNKNIYLSYKKQLINIKK